MEYVLGCDVGSQGLKTILLSREGKIISEATQDYPVLYPHPVWAEQEAEHWIQALEATVKKVLIRSGVNPGDIKALGLDSQVDGVLPVDADNQPLRPCIIWMDRRASRQCDELARRVDEERIFQVTGVNLDPSHCAPKILWIRDNEPAVFQKATKFLLPGSYVLYRLTGEWAVDYSNASSSMLFDVAEKKWSPEMFEATGISVDTMVPAVPATQVAGTLLPEMARTLGLGPDTLVVVGSGDEHAATLGAGVVKEGIVCDIAGTAEPVCAVADQPLFDQSKLVETHGHADPDAWLLENPGFVSGANYSWFRDHFGQQEKMLAQSVGMSPFEFLNPQAAAVPPGSEGLVFLPCMMGAMTPEWNADARGVFYGLTMAHSRGHVLRAILEGSAYGLHDIVQQMEESGLGVEEIRVVAGGAKGELWRQIKADVTGKTVALPETVETTSFGAALLAAVGAGFFPDVRTAAEKTVRIVERRQPIPENQEIYQKTYEIYRSVYFALKETFQLSARLGQ